MGIEPTYSAWKADALPLSYARNTFDSAYNGFPLRRIFDFDIDYLLFIIYNSAIEYRYLTTNSQW